MSPTHKQEIPARSFPKEASRWILGIFFVLAGANHFRMPATYLAMMPRWLPWPTGLNAIAGVCEILGGIGILVPRPRAAAGWGLIALLAAVFPANLHVALLGEMPGFGFSPLILWLRLPFQPLLMAWVYWAAIARGVRHPRALTG